MPTSKKNMVEVGQEEEVEVAMVGEGVGMVVDMVVVDMAEEETMMMADMAVMVGMEVGLEVGVEVEET